MKNEKFNFENSVHSLEDMVRKLENPETGLDESIEIYKKGMDLLSKCSKRLDEAEFEIIKLTKTGESDTDKDE